MSFSSFPISTVDINSLGFQSSININQNPFTTYPTNTAVVDSANSIYILDSANLGTAQGNGLQVRQQLTNTFGNRAAILGYLSLDLTPNIFDTSLQNYTSIMGLGYSDVPAKTGLIGGNNFQNYAGGLWGSNFNCWLGSPDQSKNAVHWESIYGSELDVTVFPGSDAAERYGLSIFMAGNTATIDDAFIELGQGSNGSLVNIGIEFGGIRHGWPFSSVSTMIQATARVAGGTSIPIAQYGIDFSAVTFQNGGAPLVMPLQTVTSTSPGKQGSMCWDANFIYICTATNTWKRTALSAGPF